MRGFVGSRTFGLIVGAFLALAFVSTTGSSAHAAETKITVYVDGGGTGSISSSPATLITQCRDSCSAFFTIGEQVTFTADPDPGMGFTAWGGYCASPYVTRNGYTCSFVPDNSSVYDGQGPKAYFAPRPGNDDFADAPTLAETANEVNGVNFTSSGNSTAGTHEPGEPVHAATGESASVWAKWTAPASARVEAATCFNYTNFDTSLAVYTGSALANIQKVASNDDGPLFTSCDGRTSNTGVKAELSFDAIKGVTYYFAVDGKDGAVGQYSLGLYVTRTPRPVSVSIDGSGEGTVTSSPEGISCDSSSAGSACSTEIADSRQITLTAQPAVGSTFAGFGGPCAGTSPCSLTVTDSTSITATFTKDPAVKDPDVKDPDVPAVLDSPVVLGIGKPVLNRKKGKAIIPITVDQSAQIALTGSVLTVSRLFRLGRTWALRNLEP